MMSEKIISMGKFIQRQRLDEAREQLQSIELPERLINPVIAAGQIVGKRMKLHPHASPLAPFNIGRQDFSSIWDFSLDGDLRLFSIAVGDIAVELFLRSREFHPAARPGPNSYVRLLTGNAEQSGEALLREFESWMGAVCATEDRREMDCSVQLLAAIYIAGFLRAKSIDTRVYYEGGEKAAKSGPIFTFKFCADNADVVEKSQNEPIAILFYPDTVSRPRPSDQET